MEVIRIEKIRRVGSMKMKKVMSILFASILIISFVACSSDTSGGSDKGSGSSGESEVENGSADMDDDANVDGGSAEGVETDASGTVRIAIAGWQLENGID